MNIKKELSLKSAIKIAIAPRSYWLQINQPYPWKQVYQLYLLPLFLLVAISSFIKKSMVGASIPLSNLHERYSVIGGLASSALQYAAQLLLIYALAQLILIILRRLDYNFSLDHTVTLLSFSFTALALASLVVGIIPFGSLLVIIALIISISSFYWGIRDFLKVKEQDRLLVFGLGIFSAFLLSLIIGLLLIPLSPTPSIRTGSAQIS